METSNNTIDQETHHSKDSIVSIIDQSTKRLNELRTKYQNARSSLSNHHASRCGYVFYQAQEALNKALGVIASGDYTEGVHCNAQLNIHLDLIENLLQRDKQQISSKNK